MAILDSIGTSLLVDGQTVVFGSTITFTNYIVATATAGDTNVESEDIDDEDGALKTRLIFKRHAKATLNLICKSGATPLSDFPMGDMCTYGALTAYFVESLTIERSKSAQRATVTLINLGIT
jgi:hypothetical protein